MKTNYTNAEETLIPFQSASSSSAAALHASAMAASAMASSATPSSSAVSTAQTAATASASAPASGALDPHSQSKYQQLLSVIEEMSKDIRPTYAGSKSSAERLKRGIVYARILVRECLVETERSARS